MKTDYINLYQVHRPSRNVPIFGADRLNLQAEREHVAIEETLAAPDEIVKANKVRHVGVSNESPSSISK